MQTRLKRWESPRYSGRNDKGKGGSARARQLKKRQQRLKQKLKSCDRTFISSQSLEKSLSGAFFGGFFTDIGILS
ncbi:MAG: hypothetical protein AAGG02_17465 [Cyanobacteria bacterium P01_H01_bin.15]